MTVVSNNLSLDSEGKKVRLQCIMSRNISQARRSSCSSSLANVLLSKDHHKVSEAVCIPRAKSQIALNILETIKVVLGMFSM